MCNSEAEKATGLLVIGYGNTLRGDDAAGRRVAEELAQTEHHGLTACPCHLLTPELAEQVSHAEQVIFVDASIEPVESVQLKEIHPQESSLLMGHSASPETLLALSRDIFNRVPQAWMIALPVVRMEAGEALSPESEEGKRTAVRLILTHLEQMNARKFAPSK